MLRICQNLIRILKCLAYVARRPSFLIFAFTLFFYSSLFSPVFADRFVHWLGEGGSQWSDASNWDRKPPGTQGSSDIVIFSNSDEPFVENNDDVFLKAIHFDEHTIVYDIKNKGRFFFFNGGFVNNSDKRQLVDNEKELHFELVSDAGSNIEIFNEGGGLIRFDDQSTASGVVINNKVGASIDISGLTTNEISIGKLSGAGEVILGSKTINLGGLGKNSEISGVISGEGGLKKIGQGTLTLTGNNTYQGKTFVESGILQLGNESINGLLNGDIEIKMGGELDIYRNVNLSIGTQISGEGKLKKWGGGRLTLTEISTFSGEVQIEEGVLQLGDGKKNGIVVGNIVNDAKLDFQLSGAMSYNGEMTGSGSVDINDASQSSLTLNGVNRYQGDTNINSGRLLVGDYQHPNAELTSKVNVNPNGILGGFGKIQGNVNNAGIVAAGASIGTLTIDGDYTQAANGELFTEINGDQSDLIQINGVAKLAGTLKIGLLGGFDPHAVYTILTAEEGVVGQFSNVDGLGQLAQYFLLSHVDYGVNEIQISTRFNEQAFKNAVKTANQKSIADYILVTGGNPALQALIGNLSTEKQFRSAMEQVAATVYANETEALNYSSAQFSNQLIHRFSENDGDTLFWITPYGSRGELSSDENGGLNSELFGVTLGAQAALTQNICLGVGFGFSNFSANATGVETANVDGELYQFGVYGLYRIGDFTFNAQVDFGKTSDLTTQRQITRYQTLENNPKIITATGSYSAALSSQQFQLSYFLTSNEFVRLRPFAGIAHRQISRPAFTESSDEAFALSVESSSFDLWQSQLGLDINVPITDTLSLVSSVAWQYQFADTNDSTTANVVGLDQHYTVEGVAVGRNAVLMKAGFILLDNENLNVAALYEGEFAEGWRDSGFKLQISFLFS